MIIKSTIFIPKYCSATLFWLWTEVKDVWWKLDASCLQRALALYPQRPTNRIQEILDVVKLDFLAKMSQGEADLDDGLQARVGLISILESA